MTGGVAARPVESVQPVAKLLTGTSCGQPWGICPMHGDTLTGCPASSWCSEPACGRWWNYDRLSAFCSEPVAARLVDLDASSAEVCIGHLPAIRRQMLHPEIILLPQYP